MNRLKNYVGMAAGFAVLAAVISGIAAAPAIAQAVKAALVKNVDERGRNPYQVVLSCSGSSSCIGVGTVVAPNTRLVIEHVNCLIRVDSGKPLLGTNLGGSTDYALPSQLLSSSGGGDYYTVNEQVLKYYNSGEGTRIEVATAGGNISLQVGTITGYLVDLTR